MAEKNIFVLGMDESELDVLHNLPHAEEFRFHPLLSIDELQHGQIPVRELLEKARAQLAAFEGGIDAICGYWDFPVSTFVPILSEEYGLKATSLASILKCEHKYWSRLEQQKVIDEHPRFGLVNLEGEPEVPEGVRFPMWLKPVKSFSSELAFGVEDEQEFRDAVAEIREGVSRVGRPFEYVMDRVELPPEVAEAGGQACLAEESLAGEQVAVEGYVHGGRPRVYGVLDSHDYPDRSSFLRHQYPSSLPERVVRRLKDISERVMTQVGMDNHTFSIEYFYDAETDALNLLEINPRHSQSHAELFQFVDGVPNHHCMVSLALGEDPRLPEGAGPYEVAAKWYYRRFTDGIVRRRPTEDEVRQLEHDVPGVKIEIVPDEGRRLSDLPGQDSYSYELAHLFIGAADEATMCEKYDTCTAALRFEIDEA